MKELIGALIKARAEFRSIAKDKVNPFHKSKYATLDSVLEATELGLSKHGLTIVQTVDVISERVMLVTTLYHTSGENIASRYPLPNIDDPQKMGAAITYARRYSVCALLSVTADEDDDGHLASSKPKRQADDPEGDAKVERIKAAAPEGMLNSEVLKLIQSQYGPSIKTPRQLTAAQVDEVIKMLKNANQIRAS